MMLKARATWAELRSDVRTNGVNVAAQQHSGKIGLSPLSRLKIPLCSGEDHA